MKIKIKDLKLYKTKNFFKTENFFLISTDATLDSKNWVKMEQIFANLNLQYYKTHNTVTINFLKLSIFKMFTLAINGPVIFFNFKKFNSQNILTNKLLNLNPLLLLLGLKLNNRIYSRNQIQNLVTLDYRNNIIILNKSLNKFIKGSLLKLVARKSK